MPALSVGNGAHKAAQESQGPFAERKRTYFHIGNSCPIHELSDYMMVFFLTICVGDIFIDL